LSRDAKKTAVSFGDGQGWWALIDEKRYGPFVSVHKIAFSPSGKHFVIVETPLEGGNIELLVDGRVKHSTPMEGKSTTHVYGAALRDPDLMPYVFLDESGPDRVLEGSKAGPRLHKIFDAAGDFISFPPAGKRSAYIVRPKENGPAQLIVDGQGRPIAVDDVLSPIIFDNENEFHAVVKADGKAQVVCMSAEPLSPSMSSCLRKARALHGRRPAGRHE
jgi:hypothetical protein